MPIRDEMIESSTRVNLVHGPNGRERARSWRGEGGEDVEGEEGAEMGGGSGSMMKLGGGVERPFKCVARVAILSRGERKPFAKISTEEKKRKKRSFPLKRIDIQRESALQAAVAVDGLDCLEAASPRHQ
jgi:hypothetical protein